MILFTVKIFDLVIRDHHRRIRKPSIEAQNLEVFLYDNGGASAETAAPPLSRDKAHCRRSFCHLPPPGDDVTLCLHDTGWITPQTIIDLCRNISFGADHGAAIIAGELLGLNCLFGRVILMKDFRREGLKRIKRGTNIRIAQLTKSGSCDGGLGI